MTEETSTTACLLRLLLEVRYKIQPAKYQRGQSPEADALLLIGDEALRFARTNTRYPFEIDVGFEWWLWQHLPFVFAVWAMRKDLPPDLKKTIELGVSRALAKNLNSFDEIAAEYSPQLDIPAEDLKAYLSNFVYRLGHSEEEGIVRFKELVHEHHLL
jgi:chorismate dehydratase